MGKFIGEYGVKIDDKGRMVFPSAFKSILEGEISLGFVVKRSLFSTCLEMFLYDEWERESQAIKSSLNFFNREHNLFWSQYMRDRALVEPDVKLGRISIPKKMLEEIGVDREVVFVGGDHKIEIWAKERYSENQLSNSEFLSLAEKILG